ncbi:hypothetical protein BDP27DRAFT_1403774 [Rhodocollybia butyracea]|uniref:Uncharacterized protein n=1 Tax=Rhodocollybia butyracea TaxID=206335 RepID=A0A9P5PPH6_9AGAR|nr:hypothetical protein BDP27DRAFT_1403774 [Rhodocollybia butyracea]
MLAKFLLQGPVGLSKPQDASIDMWNIDTLHIDIISTGSTFHDPHNGNLLTVPQNGNFLQFQASILNSVSLCIWRDYPPAGLCQAEFELFDSLGKGSFNDWADNGWVIENEDLPTQRLMLSAAGQSPPREAAIYVASTSNLSLLLPLEVQGKTRSVLKEVVMGHKMSQAESQPLSTFLLLARELRDQIYDYLLFMRIASPPNAITAMTEDWILYDWTGKFHLVVARVLASCTLADSSLERHGSLNFEIKLSMVHMPVPSPEGWDHLAGRSNMADMGCVAFMQEYITASSGTGLTFHDLQNGTLHTVPSEVIEHTEISSLCIWRGCPPAGLCQAEFELFDSLGMGTFDANGSLSKEKAFIRR